MVLALAGLLVALAPSPVAPRVELIWRAPATCPDAEAVHARLRELAPAPPPGPAVRVEADVARRAGPGWRLNLVMRGPGLDDRRVIEARDCRSLADVTALLIALAVAPEETAARLGPAAPADPPNPPPGDPSMRAAAPHGRVPAPSGAPPRVPEPAGGAATREGAPPFAAPPQPAGRAGPPGVLVVPPVAAPPQPAGRAGPPPGVLVAPPLDDAALEPTAQRDPAPLGQPTAAPGSPTPVRAALRLGGGGEIGAIPAWSPTAGLALALFRGAWRVELAGTYAARALAYPEPAGVGGRMLVAAGALRGCGVPRWRQLEFPLCAGLELGFVRAVARGVTDPQPAGDLWIAAQLSPGLAWVPRRFLAVTLGLDVLVALRRPGFHVASLGELARGERVGLRPMLGIEVRFP